MKDIIITNDKDKIIETYQKEQVEYTNKFIDMQEEIERLNNGWNELKKWLKTINSYTTIGEVVKKIEELDLGSDKE